MLNNIALAHFCLYFLSLICFSFVPLHTKEKQKHYIMAKKNKLTTSDYLDFDEYKRLLQCLHQDGKIIWELYARLSFCTACRVSDVLAFRWKNILNVGKCTIEEKKTKKARVITFNKSVQGKIRHLYELLGSPDTDELVFRSTHTQGAITMQYVNQKLKDFKYKYKIKIGNFSTHTFRKTFGRYVYESYENKAEALVLLNKILNHTSLQITKTYIGLTQDEIDNIFNSIKF